MTPYDHLIKRGENRIADLQDAVATARCRFLDSVDSKTRRARSVLRTADSTITTVLHEAVVPAIDHTRYQIKYLRAMAKSKLSQPLR